MRDPAIARRSFWREGERRLVWSYAMDSLVQLQDADDGGVGKVMVTGFSLSRIAFVILLSVSLPELSLFLPRINSPLVLGLKYPQRAHPTFSPSECLLPVEGPLGWHLPPTVCSSAVFTLNHRQKLLVQLRGHILRMT